MVIQFNSGNDNSRRESNAKSPSAVSGEPAAAEPKRIVVVEDERVTQTVISVILKGAGYSVVAARDAAEALSVIRAEIPHLMTLDIDLSRDASGPTRSVNSRRKCRVGHRRSTHRVESLAAVSGNAPH